MTCKDCVHRNVCKAYDPEEPECFCNHFKNKADFVEVVRCKDCKHPTKDRSIWMICKVYSTNQVERIVQKDHFCSYGERRDT